MGIAMLAAATAAPSIRVLFHSPLSRTTRLWLLALYVALVLCWLALWVPAELRLEKGIRNGEWDESDLAPVRRWLGWKALIAISAIFIPCVTLILARNMWNLVSFLTFFPIAYIVLAHVESTLRPTRGRLEGKPGL